MLASTVRLLFFSHSQAGRPAATKIHTQPCRGSLMQQAISKKKKKRKKRVTWQNFPLPNQRRHFSGNGIAVLADTHEQRCGHHHHYLSRAKSITIAQPALTSDSGMVYVREGMEITELSGLR